MTTADPEETRALGRLFGELVAAGLVVLLNGDLGAGKTCFAQGVAGGLGVSSETPVTSPSYTLLNIHRGRLPFYHFDLYRLSQVDDLADLGYDEFAEGVGLTLVEWADRMTGALAASVAVSIDILAGQQRRFRFDALDDRGEELLQQLAEKMVIMQVNPQDIP
ncbi:MAG: tRNA (adenosine(37)-N6)-threonylcarbamoyltransferase complex ATPase subunit type 1 TsaE [Deltaproteobacteria bacterium]|nr:tRNA (adenosine(37)-N6)-threonylcarbamoyltransferase complex ATPase subunit type 1 TsaE [Deltaproteobacteria bacterium]